MANDKKKKSFVHLGAKPRVPVYYLQASSSFTGQTVSFEASSLPLSLLVWLPSMFNRQQNIRKDVFPLICNLSIPLCSLLPSVLLFATQMLLFAGCHCAVLFRGRPNRKPSLSSSFLPNSFEHWLLRPVSVSTTGINFTTANPLDQIRWDTHTHACTHI